MKLGELFFLFAIYNAGIRLQRNGLSLFFQNNQQNYFIALHALFRLLFIFELKMVYSDKRFYTP